MGVTTNLAPIAPGAAQDQAIRQVTDELQDKGFVVAHMDKLVNLGAHRFALADDLRPRLLRRRDDARLYGAL